MWKKLGNWVCVALILTFCLGAVWEGSCLPGGAGGEWGRGHGLEGGGCDLLPLWSRQRGPGRGGLSSPSCSGLLGCES